jgi:hypothetical protein
MVEVTTGAELHEEDRSLVEHCALAIPLVALNLLKLVSEKKRICGPVDFYS